MDEGIYAKIETNKGLILVRLMYKETPITVANFVGLSEGKKTNKIKSTGEPYYDGIKFHRVIENFMIQGGCPLGTGVGDPGYKFNDEFHPKLRHSRAGVLSMANSGPNTNGSQFFITHVETSWLDDKHTVFGFVEEGQDVVNAISQGDGINTVKIIRKGEDAKNWDAAKFYDSVNKKNQDQEKIKVLTEGFSKTDSGLYYKIELPGTGEHPSRGSKVSIHYKGMLVDGSVFDSSYERNDPISFVIGGGQVIQGFEESVSLLKLGGKARFILPSNLAYGEAGAGGAIPPNASLIFDMELIAIN